MQIEDLSRKNTILKNMNAYKEIFIESKEML